MILKMATHRVDKRTSDPHPHRGSASGLSRVRRRVEQSATHPATNAVNISGCMLR
jgi:hypothetical protein